MIIGYKIQCRGLKEPMTVKGETFVEALAKFRDYWSADYDIDTDEITHVESIEINFDIH